MKVRMPMLQGNAQFDALPICTGDRAGVSALPRPAVAVRAARLDEIAEQGVRLHGLRLELGVKLAAHKPRMIRELDDLHEPGLGVAAADDQALFRKLLLVGVVELIAVPVALGDLVALVGGHGVRALGQRAAVCPEAHGAALFRDEPLVREIVDDRVCRALVVSANLTAS